MLDPAGLEVFRHRITAVAEAMGATLQRAAYSPNIKERLDYSCAVFDSGGRLVAQAAHIPVHLGAMPAAVAAARARVQAWSPGDVVALNDPYLGGSHLPDITTVSGVFAPGASVPRLYVATRAHHADVGGVAPGSLPVARDLFGEGIVLPPVWLARGGSAAEDVIAIVCANSRTPDERRGDLEAQLAAHHTGTARLEGLLAADPEAVERSAAALLQYSERRARAALSALPDGRFSFEDSLEGDGLSDRTLAVRVTLTISGDRLAVDFSGTSPQATGGVNAPLAVTKSAVYYVVACLLRDVPVNAGAFEPVTVTAPVGSLLNPTPPAAVAAGNVETSQRVVDAVLGALAGAVPDRVPAASQGTMNNLTAGGVDPRTGRHFTYYETMGGGAGAAPDRAGASAIQVHMTNTRNTPVEALEAAFPLHVEAYTLRTGSRGEGRRPGGDGVERRVRFLAPARVTLITERRSLAPWGLAGGGPGAAGENVLFTSEGERPLPAKGTFDVQAGDVLCVRTPGGGGWGALDLDAPPPGGPPEPAS